MTVRALFYMGVNVLGGIYIHIIHSKGHLALMGLTLLLHTCSTINAMLCMYLFIECWISAVVDDGCVGAICKSGSRRLAVDHLHTQVRQDLRIHLSI